MTIEETARFIKSNEWKHEQTNSGKSYEALNKEKATSVIDFKRFAIFVQTNGEPVNEKLRAFKMKTVGGYLYWVANNPIHLICKINRVSANENFFK